ncbi:D-alanyl-D-alanine carboxypeptidase/D-alanyl-D-alanine-endopeptidase [bacterium]|nr:D-alanyl-D-alanine carboxypeptidase/D-alanyl-D-alanine-endopeptidase [bacterium]
MRSRCVDRCRWSLAWVLLFWLLGLPVACLASLRSEIDDLLAARELRHATVGLHVVDSGTGEVLYSRNPDALLLPASNTKIVTTAAAYELLGGDFRAPTRVLAQTKPTAEGVVTGPLYLRGGGDPTLTHDKLADMAQRLYKSGLRKVTGPVVADGTAFSDASLGTGWHWQYLNDGYAAEFGALTVDSGCVTVILRGAETPGKPPLFRLEPFSEYLKLDPEATTTSGDAKPGAFRSLGRNLVSLTGPIGVNQRIETSLTVRQPALYCATLFRIALVKAGIEVGGDVLSGRTPADDVKLLQVDSPPLVEILQRINKNSDNNAAEIVLRDISMAAKGVGSCGASAALIAQWAAGFGADVEGVSLADGSGLSRSTTITARFFVQVLNHMQGRDAWVQTLPLMGKDGTLSSRLKGTAAEGKVRAKTGFISGVRSLSGYVHTKSGRRLTFSILVNQPQTTAAATAFQNKVCLLLAGL